MTILVAIYPSNSLWWLCSQLPIPIVQMRNEQHKRELLVSFGILMKVLKVKGVQVENYGVQKAVAKKERDR